NRVALFSPENVLVYFNRAMLYSQLGAIAAAIADYSKAIDLYPDFANAYINRSILRRAKHDVAGADRDHATAQRKIAEYKNRLKDSTYSIYADTTQRFDKLLSFESKLIGKNFERIASARSTADDEMTLIPMFRFTLVRPDTLVESSAPRARYYSQRVEDFKAKIGNRLLCISRDVSNIDADSLVAIDRAYADVLRGEEQESWTTLFERGISQSLIKQYTNAVNTYSAAIKLNPGNPFLYMNRATTRAEMIDFISSIDNSYQRITVDSDPAKRLQNAGTRSYSYDEAIEDMNKVIKLYPDFAYGYYNRANLMAISGRLPEAYDDYTKAIELYPDCGEAYYNRGLVQIFMKDTRKGCMDMSKAGELGIEAAYAVLAQYRIAEH
ncbi:MAG: tetratricopeptide repeat protein, partial [Alistipes sp.]|nr:tetratricopeptide repeat protein [Alistipes sp.]